ncbi:DUF1800 domain-containing protein [soil metagenome]
MRQPAISTKADAPAVAVKRINDSLQPLNAKQFGFEEARHLLLRAGFGGTVAQIQTLANWGLEKSVDYLVNYQKIDWKPADAGFRADIMHPPTQDERREAEKIRRQGAGIDKETAIAKIRVLRQNAEQDDRQQMKRLQQWWLTRMIESPRPLEEKLTLLWHGHFATSYRTVEDSWHMLMQNEMLRTNASGNFGTMLHGIIRDPAMIAFLNNNDSRKNKPNENLARELMELFSLGVGNYGEKDIKEGARALTGYTFKDDEFEFDRKNHDINPKTILGASGPMDGEDFVNTILGKRECAKFVATKLYKFFVHDYPSGRKAADDAARSVIETLASTLQGGKYDLKPVLTKLFTSQHFYEPALRGEQIKSPVQLVVGAVRSLNTPVRDLGRCCDAMARMGQDLFYPPSVKGWDGGRSWINTATLFVRQNMMVFLLTGKRPEGKDPLAEQEPFDANAMLAQLRDAYPGVTSADEGQLVDAILRFTIGRVRPAGRGPLDEFMAQRKGEVNAATLTKLMLLITAMPEYELC